MRSIFKQMKQPTAIRKLRSLHKDELRAFKRYWLRSVPAVEAQKLGAEIIQHLLTTKKETPIEALFKEQKVSESKKNAVLHKLHEAMKQFVLAEVIEHPLKKEISDELRMINFYDGRQLQDYVESSIRKVEMLLEKYPWEDDFYFYSLFLLEERVTLFLNKSLSEENNLQKENNALDVYYLSRKFRCLVFMINAQNISNVEYDYHLTQEVLSHLETKPYDNIPTIYLWRDALCLMQDPGDKDLFLKLEGSLYECVDIISPENARSFFGVLENSLRKLRSGFPSYKKKLYELYKYQLSKKVLPVNGHFPSMLFDNIVTVSLEFSNPKETREFISNYIEFVPAENRSEKASYNLARCLFAEKKLDECLEEISDLEKTKFSSIHQNLARRRLQVKTYFEIQNQQLDADPNQPERSIRALKKYLHVHKNEMSAVHERANLDFARFVNRLTEAFGDKKIEKLKSEISGTALLPEKDWLLQKVTELSS